MKDEQDRSTSYDKSWSKPNAVKFFSSCRNSIEEVYDSEKHFLTQVLRPGYSVLDIGCAAGGFYNVFRHLEPTISYTGVDISSEMIKKAQALHPGLPFHVSRGDKLPFNDQSFDVVFCSGALHMTFDWRDVLKEGWRVTKNYFVFDVRLTENSRTIEDMQKSYEKIAFFNEWDGTSIVPYIIINVNDFLHILESLDPVPALQQVYGYYHAVSEMTVSPEKEVCMTMCCLGKTKKPEEQNKWEIPIHILKTGQDPSIKRG
jgi:ubiquinone/menaquinone biosynthesis C-methylase UbiE